MTKEQLFIHLVEILSSPKLFHGHGVVDAEDEAMMVMMAVFKQSVDEILTSGNNDTIQKTMDKAIGYANQRINSVKPMPYILGEVNFCQLNFKCDDRALVPRSPIAELIQKRFTPWIDINNTSTALDLCTGGGCIGISLAKYYQHIQVDISDISRKALDLAKENNNKLSAGVGIVQSDLFQNIHKVYDLIVTNPPYVSQSEYQELPNEYKAEPKLGLVTGKEGLRIPVEIMLSAPSYLNDNGYLFLEVGYSDVALDEAFPEIQFEWIKFANGGQGVCALRKGFLSKYADLFKLFLGKRF